MPHGSRIRPKQIAETFEDRSLLHTWVHSVPLKGWSVEVWTPQLGEAGVLEGKVHEGVYGVQLSLDEVKGWTAVLTKKTCQLTSPALRNTTRYSNCEMAEGLLFAALEGFGMIFCGHESPKSSYCNVIGRSQGNPDVQ